MNKQNDEQMIGHRNRKTDGQTDGETDERVNKQTNIELQMDRKKEIIVGKKGKHKCRERERQKDIQTNK